MSIFLIVIAIIVVFIIHQSIMKKIDEEEAKALKTPGTATFLRNNFGGFIDEVLRDDNNYILFERAGQIRFGKKDSPGYELIIGNRMEFDGPIMYTVIKRGQSVVCEMSFKEGTNTNEISNKVLSFFN